MPLYEYRCDACGKNFEVIQKFSDDPLTTHAGCGGHVQRLLSPPALQFKGTGWYVTDYARKGSNGFSGTNGNHHESKSETKSEAKTESSSSTAKADAKPASKR
jgi:putative FmdB family regulatory protein